MIIKNLFIETLPKGCLNEDFSIISGRAFQTNETTAAVTRPSTIPIARWIGCIKIAKLAKGNSVFPENNVSTTTLKAPI
ncbi:hypothetical protein SDC9_210282 [bioreactor metagenome]|uniref:Uncharacterized protein n=1 Tax=bioreactor metagenome TaxID=1076179 RepID=A0A645JT99_9ZZZZ